MAKLSTTTLSLATIFSLFLFDYIQGNGAVDMLTRVFCKGVCFARKIIGYYKIDFRFPMILSEMTFLFLTLGFLRLLRRVHAKDRIDELLQESRDTIKQTDKFLDKWRISKVNWQSNDYPCFNENQPQQVKPFRLEVPILHMAIIDKRDRNQFERGDAGDTINISDTTLLSMTSILDEDLHSIPELEEKIDTSSNVDIDNRCLWDVMEGDIRYEN